MNSIRPIFKMYMQILHMARIPRLVSEKPPTCHNDDTVCRTKNRIPRCTPQKITKFITKSSDLTINGLARTPATEHALIKALILVLCLLQVVGTVKISHFYYLELCEKRRAECKVRSSQGNYTPRQCCYPKNIMAER